MGRAPCCDKANVKKGPWSPEEDAKLKSYIDKHGTAGNWIALPPKIGLKRCGKSCRLRWLNYLRPNIKHGGFTEEEDHIICSLYISIGSRWSIIAAQLPGRTDNDIKNYWNTRLKKKLLGKQRSRRGKQELKTSGNGGDNSLLTNNNVNVVHQSPNYWPEPPVLAAAPMAIPYSSSHQEQGSIDSQASMRRLLIKLGGRFSYDDHDHNDHVAQDSSSSTTGHHQQLYEPTLHVANEGGSNLQTVLQGQSSLSSELVQEMPQRLDHGMEFLYGELDMVNYNIIRAADKYSCETINNNNGWGIDTSSLLCPPPVASGSEYGEMLQEFAFNELR